MPTHRPRCPNIDPPKPLEQRLTLAAWFADQMGYSSNREMLADLQECREDWEDGQHPVLLRAALRGKVKIDADALLEMDENIRLALNSINHRRYPPVSLKYFQYLAALAAENFLQRYSTGPKQLLADLRAFADDKGEHFPKPKSEGDLRKLALWIATGGGKTLLMHLNYHQFLRRKNELFTPDNVILVTPNETLSAQHIEEMRHSGIPCFQHGERMDRLEISGNYPVRVLEITKLAATRRGAATVSTESFEGRNLVFVDEGHRGAGGEAWFQRRDELAAKGFVFEYSATFGQALATADARTEEYACAIAMDYSYRHFYNDGYGKEFDVVNLGGKDPTPEKQDALMLGNLLVFLQQRMCFAENHEEFSRHNLESPLLLMLGATVTGGQGRTDMAEFMGFLSRVALDRDRDNRRWLEKTAGRILRGKSGISGPDKKDVFANRLRWLNRRFEGTAKAADTEKVCRALLKHVFRADNSGALQFCAIPGAKGEAVLRVSGGDYFGLMFVGDVVSKLREKFEDDEECANIQFPLEISASPMFSGVARPDSPINILIGAKKFMEGWSSWRVSGMGLLNVGVNEGPLVIQLFGRGVRLKGVGMSLKRGGTPNSPPPPNLPLLETMNIFGIRANFVERFREYLEREGVMDEVIHLPLSHPLQVVADKKLIVPEYPDREEFLDAVLLAPDENICAVLDMSSSALRIASARNEANNAADAPEPVKAQLPSNALAMVDWDKLHRQLQEYREKKGYWNLVFPRENLPVILRNHCQVIRDADSSSLEPTSRRNLQRIRSAAFAVMRKYADKFYAARKGEWELSRIRYGKLDLKHPNLQEENPNYVLRIPQKEENLIKEMRALVADEEKLETMRNSDSNNWDDPPPRIHFCRHLYQPLLLAGMLQDKNVRVSPPGLNKGEVKFITALREYWERVQPSKIGEIFLLRNQSQTGLGFHSEFGGVYPDFILWIKGEKKQRIIFIEPHGMVFADAHEEDPKARIYETLKPAICKLKDERPDVQIDAFVVSQTSYKKLSKKYGKGWTPEKFKDCHILFAEDDYIARILEEKE